ncbi:MAG: proline--tRNA ligase [Patescibacteria group bacterium]|nr:proline--tRNA ligase [Patescibacteria group bacterium]
MKYSQLPIKTSKTISGELTSKNARLLIQAGFIHQEMAGVYTFLTLGLRVLSKIENIIREEMNTIGAEILMTSLAPMENWVTSKRLDSVDVLMKTTPANTKAKLKHDAEYVLSPTHEDMVTPMMREFNRSYKDFPFALYQIQTKFRNEPRAKSGLLRCREFRMKDLYSFHTNEESLKKYYEASKEVYWRVFNRLGFDRIDTFITLASGGDFTKDYSHEFQTVCEAGEDIVFRVASSGLTFNREVAPSKAPIIDQSSHEEKPLQEVEGAGIIGVEEVAVHVGIKPEQTTKTLIFENENEEIIVAAVRGGYDVNEEKLKKVSGSEKLVLAREETIEKVTGAKVGYAGLLNLPKDVKIFMDESMQGRKNFEMGANKTNYHSVNVNFGRDLPLPEKFHDIKIAKEGDLYPETGEVYDVFKTAEIGNIFPLGTKYAKLFNYYYTDENGKEQLVYMGSYGIGPSRIMGVLVEKYADEKGLVWSDAVAPFRVHLISLKQDDRAQDVYKRLQEKSIDVFYDDRDVSAGQKFADADLLGIPVRLVVSPKTGEKIEWKKRTEQTTELLDLDMIFARLQK